MGKRKAKKTTAPNDIAPETWAKIGVWLADHLGDMERATFVLDEEMGADFMPALRGIAEHLRTGKSLIEPSSKPVESLWDACAKWRDKHRVICAESIYQTDHVNLACPELATAVCNVIGYAETEDE